MDWKSKKCWAQEDALYFPKRKVNNKGSRNHEHIIGSIPSRKMNRSIGYESFWGECLFYYLLEIDPLTVRYYAQPVEVTYTELNAQYALVEKKHVPDTLVFRQTYRPHLFQVKGGNNFIEQKPHLFQASSKYAQEHGWCYSVVHPKLIPSKVQSNLILLMNYMKPREYYDAWIPEILNKMLYLKNPTVEHLAKSFSAKIDHRDILPIIYHLIFRGDLRTDIFIPVNICSVLELGDLSKDLITYFHLEGDTFVASM
ncbi:hypothetical protein A8709_32475 [Paenibacillus pectinilyticus]|uniref:TnsA endonuclease N-terminal domain-containing protein n=1 Tax=Paenibacillus pectinilyticus TaxID=512399 RepID=A0A1C0ZWR8_9BACL|nr:hypothetical protein [Paenibacillus pectinilyticus]OCT12539.1 hypothetical protein A8709_32475 [Paenibacillus pectinilyticus]